MKRENLLIRYKCRHCGKYFYSTENHAYHLEGKVYKKPVCSYKCENDSIKAAEQKKNEIRRKKLEAKYQKMLGVIGNEEDS